MNKKRLEEILKIIKAEQKSSVKSEYHYILIKILEALLEE